MPQPRIPTEKELLRGLGFFIAAADKIHDYDFLDAFSKATNYSLEILGLQERKRVAMEPVGEVKKDESLS